nr:hypothetical protein [Nostoc sp. SerVER01]
MRTTTLTKTVLMIIWVIWFGADGIDTKAHEWGLGSGEAGEAVRSWGFPKWSNCRGAGEE